MNTTSLVQQRCLSKLKEFHNLMKAQPSTESSRQKLREIHQNWPEPKQRKTAILFGVQAIFKLSQLCVTSVRTQRSWSNQQGRKYVSTWKLSKSPCPEPWKRKKIAESTNRNQVHVRTHCRVELQDKRCLVNVHSVLAVPRWFRKTCSRSCKPMGGFAKRCIPAE